MPRLRWDGDNVFRDTAHDLEASPRDREHTVSEDQAERYLEHRSGNWSRVSADADADTEAVDEDEDAGDDQGDTDDQDDTANEESDDQDEDEDQDAVDEDETGAEPFDAEAFIDEDWRKVKPPIDAGDVDEHLEAIRKAEKARENGPRDSVMGAIDKRQAE